MKLLQASRLVMVLVVLGAMALTSCSPTIVEPFYTDINRVMNLRTGMNKEEARMTLGVYPFDILHNQFDGCEIHHYLYPDRLRTLSQKKWQRNLKEGDLKKTGRNDLYLIFRDGDLETFFSGKGKDAKPLLEFKDDLLFVCGNPDFIEGPVYGCTDPASINYDSKATEDNGACEYCPCDYVKNPWHDPVRECGEPCITEKELERRMKAAAKNEAAKNGDDCDVCDIIEKGLEGKAGKVEINLNIDADNLKSNKQSTIIQAPLPTNAPQNIFKRKGKKGKATSFAEPRDASSGSAYYGATVVSTTTLGLGLTITL